MSIQKSRPKPTARHAAPAEVVEATLAGGSSTGEAPEDLGATKLPATGVEQTMAFSAGSSEAPPTGSRPSVRAVPVVAGYEILGELGRGSVGVVYHARQVRLNRPCALKMILAGEHSSPDAALRFLAEAEAIARLQHPNVVQIHNLGESGGLPFVELEYAPGGSLDRQLDGVPWAPRAAARAVEAIARGVAEAHKLGIVHRDLKPANVLLGLDGTPKVTDFGLAKSVGHETGLTQTESVLGTPSYMAPEQARGEARQVGPPADVYSLGAILYELVTGRPPLRGATILETLALVESTEPVPPTRLAPGLPRDLETICLKCLEKDPARRYGSAEGLAADLGRWLDGDSIEARPATLLEKAWKSARRRPWQAAMVVLATLFLASLLGVWVWSYARIGEALEVSRGERKRADEARADSDRLAIEARRLAASEASARAESTRRSAALALDKGVLLAESGRVGRGLLWMDRAFVSAEGLDEPLRRAARASLGDWGRRTTRPSTVVDLGRAVHNLDYHPDLGLIALGALERPILLDSATLGRPRELLVEGQKWNVKAVLDRDGRRLWAVEGTSARAWDFPSGALVGQFPRQVPEDHPNFVVPDPSGQRAVLTDYLDGRMWVWEPTAEGSGVARQVLPAVGYLEAAFSPDGRFLASVGKDRVARVWDARTLAPVFVAPARAEPAFVAFLPVGACLLILEYGANPKIAAWDLGSPAPRFDRPLGAEPAGLAFRSDGRAVLIGGRDGSIRLLDAASGEAIGPVIHAESPVRGDWESTYALHSSVALSPDGQTILSSHADATARAWDVATGRLVGSMMEHSEGLVGVGFGPDGRTALTVTEGGRASLWDLAEGPTGWPLGHRPDLGLDKGEVSPDGRLVAATGLWTRHAALLDVATGLPRTAPLLHGGQHVRVARFSPDGSLLATGGDDRNVRLWDTSTGRPVGRPLACDHWATTLAFSPDGRTLAAIHAGQELQAWTIPDGKPIPIEHSGLRPLKDGFLLCSPDGRTLLTRTHDWGEVVRREVPSYRRVGGPVRPGSLETLDAAGKRVEVSSFEPFAFSPDGATLWSVERGQNPGWSAVSRRDPATLRSVGPAIGWGVSGAALSADGRRLLVRSGTTARLLDTATGERIGAAMDHPSTVLEVAFVPGGLMIATGSEDGGLRFWDAATGRPIGPARPHPGPVGVIRFVDGGRRVATFVGTPTIWDVPRTPADDPARIAAVVRAASMMELDDEGDGTRRLDTGAWRSLRDGPGKPDDESRLPDAEWHRRLGARFALRGRPEAALWHLDRLLADWPDDAAGLLRRAEVRARLGDRAGSLADESRATGLDRGLAGAWRAWRGFDRMGRFEAEGRIAEALADLDELIVASPGELTYRATRARLRLRLGRRAGAAADYLALARSRRGPSNESYRFALLALDLGDQAGYREECSRLLSFLPAGAKPDAGAANSVAWELVLAPDNPWVDRAVALAEAAVASLPEDRKWLAINTLGAALYRAGQYSEAVRTLTESVRRGGGEGVPQDWAFLALAYRGLGDDAAARRWLGLLQGWKPSGTAASFWDDLEIELLRREALAVVRFDPAFPAYPFLREGPGPGGLNPHPHPPGP